MDGDPQAEWPPLTEEEEAFCRRLAVQSTDWQGAFLLSFADAALVPERFVALIVHVLLQRPEIQDEIAYLRRVIRDTSRGELLIEYEAIRMEAMREGKLDVAASAVASKAALLGFVPKSEKTEATFARLEKLCEDRARDPHGLVMAGETSETKH